MPYVSGLVNGIQARENHKSVNGMQLNGIRAVFFWPSLAESGLLPVKDLQLLPVKDLGTV